MSKYRYEGQRSTITKQRKHLCKLCLRQVLAIIGRKAKMGHTNLVYYLEGTNGISADQRGKLLTLLEDLGYETEDLISSIFVSW